MTYPCPYCTLPVDLEHPLCICGCDLIMLRPVVEAARSAVRMALLELKTGNPREAMDFAYESWELLHSHEASAAGLLAAVAQKDPIEISRWLRRRQLPESWPAEDRYENDPGIDS